MERAGSNNQGASAAAAGGAAVPGSAGEAGAPSMRTQDRYKEAAEAARLAVAMQQQRSEYAWVHDSSKRVRGPQHRQHAPRTAQMEHQAVLSRYVATITRDMPQNSGPVKGFGGRAATTPADLASAATAAAAAAAAAVAAAGKSIPQAAAAAAAAAAVSSGKTSAVRQEEQEHGAPLLIAALPVKRSKRSNSIAESAAAAAASVSSVPNEVASGSGSARPAPTLLPQGAHMMALAVGMNLVPATSTPSAMGTAQGDKDAAPADARAVQECVKQLKERVPWFDFARVAPLEREHLARAGVVLGRDVEESVYVEARNALVRHSAEHPEASLTMTYARRLLRIDAAVAMRIHSLLSAHALINSRQHVAAPGTDNEAESAAAAAAAAAVPAAAVETERPNDEEQQRLVTQLHQRVLAQQCQRAVPVGKKRPAWTDKEHEALLEALETDPTNWDRVQQAVGGAHSKEDCLAHFVQLPVEDAYLEDQLSLASAALQQAAAQHTTVAGLAEQQRHAEARQQRAVDLVRVLAAYANTDSAQSAVLAAKAVLLRHRQQAQRLEDEQQEQEQERLVLGEAEQTIERLEQRLERLAEYEHFVEDEWARLEWVRKHVVCDRLACQSEDTDGR